MTKTTKKKLNRRRFILGGFRYSALGLIGTGSVAITLKRRRLLREGKCLENGICSQCRVYNECGHPRALSVKQNLSERDNG